MKKMIICSLACMLLLNLSHCRSMNKLHLIEVEDDAGMNNKVEPRSNDGHDFGIDSHEKRMVQNAFNKVTRDIDQLLKMAGDENGDGKVDEADHEGDGYFLNFIVGAAAAIIPHIPAILSGKSQVLGIVGQLQGLFG